jgi:cyclophilin family peptidyl-prolyl cis-trans isomerase
MAIFWRHRPDPEQASRTVPARVGPNGDGSTFFITFFQPPLLDDVAFDAAAKEIEVELMQLK